MSWSYRTGGVTSSRTLKLVPPSTARGESESRGVRAWGQGVGQGTLGGKNEPNE